MGDPVNAGKPTLTQFIDTNHKLISTLAIFAALSAFAKNLPDPIFGKILSFLFFTLGILIYLEICMNIPYTEGGKLHWFCEILSLSMFVYVVAWVEMYHTALVGLLFIVLLMFALLLAFTIFHKVIRKVLERTKWFANLNARKQEAFSSLAAMAVTALALLGGRRYGSTLVDLIRHVRH
jgi:hypothetical protein